MKKYILFCILCILYIFSLQFIHALDSELSISCGGDSEIYMGCLGDNELFWIGLNESIYVSPPNVPEIVKGSMGGGNIFLEKEQISKELCIATYYLAENNITNITEILNFSKSTVEIYTYNWQAICSDLIMKSLHEELICNYIKSIKNYTILKETIEQKLKISDYLLIYYINGYNEICIIKNPYSLVSIKEEASTYINNLGIIFIALLLILLSVFLIKKKKLLWRLHLKED